MRVAFIPALFVILLLCLFSCSAPRYATYNPPGEAPWKVTAVKTMSGWVIVTIDEKEVLKGQYPIFGEQEFRATYKGRGVSMVLRKRHEHKVTIFECLLFADYNQIGQWNW